MLIELDVYGDERGRFAESFQIKRYAEFGLPTEFRQDSFSLSAGNVLRGLHYQIEKPQGHLVTVLSGQIHDVGLDLRTGSPAFGRAIEYRLDAAGPHQIYLPPGVAHGFCVLSESALIHYKCTDLYAPGDEGGVLWSDPDLGIAWPARSPVITPRDRAFPRLRDVTAARLPKVSVG